MRIPLSWLKEFVDITIPVSELALKLTFAGLEVESIEYIGVSSEGQVSAHARGGPDSLVWDRDKIFVGQLVQVKPHPNADRLTLAVVDYGRAEPIQVVTGAPNIRVGDTGQKVVLALEGSRLYDGHKPGRELMTLKKSKIRGIESGSMVCSEKELGLSDEHEGIIILPQDAPVGLPLADYLGDVVLDFKINPNFARSQSVLGIAREVAALTGRPLKDVGSSIQAAANGPETDLVRIEIADSNLSARYSAAMIRGVKSRPSPFVMQRRLALAGMRPIDNIVDITNYTMIERGQPLHAFDYDKLVARAGGGKPTIIVRPARQGEKMRTLDGVERQLTPSDLLITDTAGPIAIAGVMGGADTEVSDETRNVLLESANFDYISVRRTTAAQKLPSEAATRFGRGISPVQTIPAVLRASQLLQDLAGGETDPVIADNYPAPVVEPAIELTTREVKRMLGIDIPIDEIERILHSLDFAVDGRAADTLLVTPPDYRLDVDGLDDVIEEIARIYGYERIPSTLISGELPPARTNESLEREELARNLLVRAELDEVMTYTMTTPAREALLSPPGAPAPARPAAQLANPEQFDPRPSRPYVEIENPISPERTVMRQSLLPSILDVLASNLRFTNRALLFEVGKVFLSKVEGEGPSQDELPEDLPARLPLEVGRLAVVMTGPREPPSWQGSDFAPMDFFDLKGVVQELTSGLHIQNTSYAASANPIFHPGRGAVLRIEDDQVGVLGELHPVVRQAFDLPAQPVVVAELDLLALLSHADEAFRVRPISRFPVVVQDIALLLDETVPAAQVEQLILQSGGVLLREAWLFDVYLGAPLPAGKKSLAYRLTFQAPDRGLTDEDAARIRGKIVQRLTRELGAELRTG